MQLSTTGAIVFVTYQGAVCVLKVLHVLSYERLSASALEHDQGHGAVKVIRSAENVILLERIVTGTPLKTLSLSGRDKEATQIFCDVVRKLHNNNYSRAYRKEI